MTKARPQKDDGAVDSVIADVVRKAFDVEFFLNEYRHFPISNNDPASWYATRAWVEGYCPTSWFDSFAYLQINNDVQSSKINPFYHFLQWGFRERRRFRSPTSIHVLNQALFGRDVDWYAATRKHLDVEFYRNDPTLDGLGDIDYVAHYCFVGWRLQLKPNAEFASQAALENRALLVPPTVLIEGSGATTRSAPASTSVLTTVPHALANTMQSIKEFDRVMAEVGELSALVARTGVIETRPAKLRVADRSHSIDDELSAIEPYFDDLFYLFKNQDVEAAEIDPLAHYHYTGWKELRDPTSWFSTEFYLEAYQDIREAKIDPFWHYVVAGRAEGRLPAAARESSVKTLRGLQDPLIRASGYVHDAEVPIGVEDLREALARIAPQTRRGLIISVSHDCYVAHTGGVQFFIADEQKKFARLDYLYVHISPARPGLLLRSGTSGEYFKVVVDGHLVGTMEASNFAGAIAGIAGNHKYRKFIVHSFLGHSVDALQNLCMALEPEFCFYWIHDYSSICSGYTLLRNDLQYCHAPPQDSNSCSVCVYGRTREAHMQNVDRLFNTMRFIVISPSRAAMDLWLGHSSLEKLAHTVVEHCRLTTPTVQIDGHSRTGAHRSRIRVAYLGYPASHKGWACFSDVMSATMFSSGYEFYQFSTASSRFVSSFLRHVTVQVSDSAPTAMIDALIAHQIDLVVMAAPWAETFSYAAFEAMAAGCHIVTTRASGNVADAVSREYKGVVLKTQDDLVEFFSSHAALGYVETHLRQGSRYTYALEHNGTTAAILGQL